MRDPSSTLFPYTTLFRSGADQAHHLLDLVEQRLGRFVEQQVRLVEEEDQLRLLHVAYFRQVLEELGQDRKSTRLNSSHSQISYAVFCLKKKKSVAPWIAT